MNLVINKINPYSRESISMGIADSIYGIAGIALLTSGIYRVIKYGQGADFYTQNPIFWTKIIIFASKTFNFAFASSLTLIRNVSLSYTLYFKT